MAGDAPSGDTVGPGSLPPRCPQGQSPRLTQHLLSCSPKPINRGATGATPPPGTGVPPRPSTMGVRKPPPENAEKLTKGGGGKKKKSPEPRKGNKKKKEKTNLQKIPQDSQFCSLAAKPAPGRGGGRGRGSPGTGLATGPPPGHHGGRCRPRIFIRITIAVFCFFFLKKKERKKKKSQVVQKVGRGPDCVLGVPVVFGDRGVSPKALRGQSRGWGVPGSRGRGQGWGAPQGQGCHPGGPGSPRGDGEGVSPGAPQGRGASSPSPAISVLCGPVRPAHRPHGHAPAGKAPPPSV